MTPTDPNAGPGTGELDQLKRTMADLEKAAGSFGATLTRGLKAAVIEGRSLEGVLKGALLDMSGRFLDAALAPLSKKLSELAATFAGGLVPAFAGLIKGIVPFAKGGVVSAPTYFPMPGGGTGLAGEAGAEAILPLARGPDGRLGVRGEAGAVNVTFNVTAADADSFRRSEAQLTGMLARAVGRGRRGL
jgi:phage-related minor tail protein